MKCYDTGNDEAVPDGVTTDLDGNPRIVCAGVDMGAFEVPLLDAIQLLRNLIQDVVDLNIQEGIENSLDSKLDAAVNALDDLKENNDVAAINSLEAFMNAVEAQEEKKILEVDALYLIDAAQEIIDLIIGE